MSAVNRIDIRTDLASCFIGRKADAASLRAVTGNARLLPLHCS